MPSTITITCPQCGKKSKGPEELFGKKVRCKECGNTFAVKGGAARPPAKPEAGKSKGKPPTGQPAKPAADDDDDEGESKPYEATTLDLSPRCPECANELESAEAVICLHCGYNTRTRQRFHTRKVHDTTGGDWFFWLLPGIACALAVLALIGLDIWYLLAVNKVIDKENDSWYVAMWAYGAIQLWVVIMSLFLMWLAGKYAFKRLVLHYRPPEVEKVK